MVSEGKTKRWKWWNKQHNKNGGSKTDATWEMGGEEDSWDARDVSLAQQQ